MTQSFMTLLKDCRADLIHDDHNRHRDHCSGALQCGGGGVGD